MAIDSADNLACDDRRRRRWQRWAWDPCTPWAQVGRGTLLGLVLIGGAAGCSKGGAPDLEGCPKLSDLVPGDGSMPPLRTNYVVLKSATAPLNTAIPTIPVALDAAGAGMHTFSQCDQPDTYSIDKAVLVTKQGNPLLEATSISGGYQVKYANGARTTVSGANFIDVRVSFSDPNLSKSPAVMVQSLSANSVTMVNQGDAIPVQVNLMGGPCAIRESQWWLTTASVGTPPVTAMQSISGGSGALTLRVPPTLPAGQQYYLAGQVTLSSGRVLQIRRVTATDMNYTLSDALGQNYTLMPVVPVVSFTVAAKGDVDTTAPSALGVAVSPVAPVRCGTVTLNLHLKDNQPLPAGQQVKMWLGTAAQPKITSTMVVGSEYLSGSVQLPRDAPAGVWFAWPEVIRDAAGNEAVATFNADGTFSLSGQDAMAKPVPAGTFMLGGSFELQDMASAVDLAAPVDLGPAPDMAMPLPAVLTTISVKPGSIPMIGGTANIYVTWTDAISPLK